MSYWIAGATVVSSVAGPLLNKKKSDPNAAYQANLNNKSSDLVNRADTLSRRAYTPYKGERVAGLSQNENMAGNLARTGSSTSLGYFDKAGKSIDSVSGSEWNAETQKKYMDPYIGGVVDTTLRKERTAYDQEQNNLRGKAASLGALGGSRATLLEVGNTGKHFENVGDITNKGYSDAYGQAFNAWQSDNDRKLKAASAYESVGGNIAQLNRDQVQDLMVTGQADRVVRQFMDDTDYQAFTEQRDWDVNNLEPLIRSLAAARGGNVQQDNSREEATSSMLGGIASAIGYFGANKSPSEVKTVKGGNTNVPRYG